MTTYKRLTMAAIASCVLAPAAVFTCMYFFYQPLHPILIPVANQAERAALEKVLRQRMPLSFHCYLCNPTNEKSYQEFVLFLIRNKCHNIVEPWQLLRQPYRMILLRDAPFIVPPRHLWKNIVPTLRFLQKEVIPAVGELRVETSYRDGLYNYLTGGAKGSRHLYFSALDLEPVRPMDNKLLRMKLTALWNSPAAKRYQAGIGVYPGPPFHVDTMYRWRIWNDYQPAIVSLFQ